MHNTEDILDRVGKGVGGGMQNVPSERAGAGFVQRQMQI